MDNCFTISLSLRDEENNELRERIGWIAKKYFWFCCNCFLHGWLRWLSLLVHWVKRTVYKKDRDFSNSLDHFRVSSENVFNKSWTWQFIQEKLMKVSLLDSSVQKGAGWEITGAGWVCCVCSKPNPLLQGRQAGHSLLSAVNTCQCQTGLWQLLVLHLNPCSGGNSND